MRNVGHGKNKTHKMFYLSITSPLTDLNYEAQDLDQADGAVKEVDGDDDDGDGDTKLVLVTEPSVCNHHQARMDEMKALASIYRP